MKKTTERVSKLKPLDGKRWILNANIEAIEARIKELGLKAERSNILSVYYFDKELGRMEHFEKLSPISEVHSFSSATFRKAQYSISDLGLWAPDTLYTDCTFDEFYSRMSKSPPSHVISMVRIELSHHSASYLFELDLELGTVILTITGSEDADYEKLVRPFSSMIEAELNELEYITRLLRLDQLIEESGLRESSSV